MKIMTEHFCTYAGKRDEVLVAYLYGELGDDERAAFDRHVAACAPCRVELTALRGVRSELARWTPPESATQVPFTLAPAHPQKSIGAVIREIPAWAQVMAATLILGAAAGLANLDVRYNADGLSVRTGWRQSASDETARASVGPAATPSVSSSTAPWRSDLAALEQQLRTDLQVHPATASPSTASNDDAVLRRVRQLIEDSERRQQSELALRVAEVTRDMQSQRQADLVKIDRTLGLIQNSSRIEVMRTQRQVNSLAQQVSQRP
jgi:hypothetical protein